MLKNYLKIALRNLFKHKIYSAINIFGLSVGIACCLLILLFVQNEWSFDTFHSKADRLYRAWVHEDYGENEVYFNSVTPIVLASTLENSIPEVEATCRVFNFGNLVKETSANESFSETITMVGTNFFTMFDFELIKGEATAVFANPNSVVLTQDMARQLFGDGVDPLGRVVSVQIGETFRDFNVTGIAEAPPSNSSIWFEILIPFTNSQLLFSEGAHNSWFNVSPETYVLLHEGSDAGAVKPKLTAMMQSILGERYSESNYTVGLQPITDIHLNTDIPEGIAQVSDPTYSYILGAIALLVLLIACVNFMTLSISRSTSRAREVGIRKTVGAQRRHLMYQFWGEALLMTALALTLGVILAEVLLPYFNILSGTELTLSINRNSLLTLLLAAVGISLIAGIYPALVLSGFKPVEVLKGKLSLSGDKNLFRQAMVVFQFTLSIALISGTLIIHKQLNYVRSTDLGYQKEQVVVLETGLRSGPNNPLMTVIEEGFTVKDRLASETASYNRINGISMASYTPVQTGGWFSADFKEANGRRREFHFNIVDYEFLSTYDIQVVQGRGFSRNNPSDVRRAIVVNQALVEDYGWDNPIGQRLTGPNFEDHEIIGVVENFHYQSLHSSVEPLVLTINPMLVFSGINNISVSGSPTPRLSVRISSNNVPETMELLQSTWTEVAPGTPFRYTFVDEAVDAQYRQEERLSQIVSFGSTLAIVIACLGLFGLASLMIVRRTKEIGVRKVLGASSGNIVLLVNREFTRLVAIAFVIAVPIAWYVMQQWLEDFAYRINIGAGVFLIAGLATLFVAWLTVSYQSVKATLVNPVDSLHSE
jgi:putative ABC transport system permease protein